MSRDPLGLVVSRRALTADTIANMVALGYHESPLTQIVPGDGQIFVAGAPVFDFCIAGTTVASGSFFLAEIPLP